MTGKGSIRAFIAEHGERGNALLQRMESIRLMIESAENLLSAMDTLKIGKARVLQMDTALINAKSELEMLHNDILLLIQYLAQPPEENRP